MLVAGTLLAWGVAFHVASLACFKALHLYTAAWCCLLRLAARALERALGVRPAAAPQQPPLERPQRVTSPELRLLRLESKVAALAAHSAQHRQEQAPASPTETWWANSAAELLDATSRSASSCCLSLGSEVTLTSSRRATGQAACCAAAAATAIAVASDGAAHPCALAAAVGTAALLASRLSDSSVSHESRHPRAVIPPLEFEASPEEQLALDADCPPDFLCPLGRTLMTDPCVTPSGFTYNRSCLLDYIARTGRDPARYEVPLSAAELIPNVNLRDQVACFLQRRGFRT